MSATTLPGWTRPLRTPISKPMGKMSESMTAASSLTPSGILCREFSAKGTRTYSAWVPSMRWPKIQPMPETPRRRDSARAVAGGSKSMTRTR